MVENVDAETLPGLKKKVDVARSNGWQVTARHAEGPEGQVYVIYVRPLEAPLEYWQLLVYGPQQTKTWFSASSGFYGHMDGTRACVAGLMKSVAFWKKTTAPYVKDEI